MNNIEQPKPLSYIDLFAGCGGLSLGLHNAKWRGLFAIEKSPLAFKTLEHNLIKNPDFTHFDWPKWLPKTNHDINQVIKDYKPELQKLTKTVDLVAGGPPCQGFSTAGKREEKDKRNSLIKSYVRFIKIVKPKIIFFENVKGFTMKFEKNKTKGKAYSHYVIRALTRAGYKVSSDLVDFSLYGIPQKRTRFILVGLRNDIADNLASGSINFFKLLNDNKQAFLVNKGIGVTTTLQQAISDLLMKNGTTACPDSIGFDSGKYSESRSNYQKLMRGETTLNGDIADSHRFAKHGTKTTELFSLVLKMGPRNKKIEGDDRKNYGIVKRSLVALDASKPAMVLTSHPDDYIHYCEPRILTVREYARVQSFPDWYEFKGKYTTGGLQRKKEVPRYTQLGNAIPPLFGELVGLALYKILLPS